MASSQKPEPRKPGSWKGKIWIADNFDDPLPDEMMRAFCGEDKNDFLLSLKQKKHAGKQPKIRKRRSRCS